MKTYGVKFIDFLAGYRPVILKGPLELISLRRMCEKVGLRMFGKENWVDLLGDIERYDRQHRRIYDTEPEVYVEYRNDKGFSIYKETKEKLVDWYGDEPLTVKELEQEFKEEE